MTRPVPVTFIRPNGTEQVRLVVPLWPTRAAKCETCGMRHQSPCPHQDSGSTDPGGEPAAEVA